jgi:hypothetical protein
MDEQALLVKSSEALEFCEKWQNKKNSCNSSKTLNGKLRIVFCHQKRLCLNQFYFSYSTTDFDSVKKKNWFPLSY